MHEYIVTSLEFHIINQQRSNKIAPPFIASSPSLCSIVLSPLNIHIHCCTSINQFCFQKELMIILSQESINNPSIFTFIYIKNCLSPYPCFALCCKCYFSHFFDWNPSFEQSISLLVNIPLVLDLLLQPIRKLKHVFFAYLV